MDIYKNLEQAGLQLPDPPPKGGVYSPAKSFGNGLIYLSGCGPALNDETIKGRLGEEFSVEEGQEFARNCILNLLAVLEREIGNLNKVKNVVKISVFVSSADDFYEQPDVANGSSALLVDIFGDEVGKPSRSAIGVNVLPGGIPVEVEGIFEIEKQLGI